MIIPAKSLKFLSIIVIFCSMLFYILMITSTTVVKFKQYYGNKSFWCIEWLFELIVQWILIVRFLEFSGSYRTDIMQKKMEYDCQHKEQVTSNSASDLLKTIKYPKSDVELTNVMPRPRYIAKHTVIHESLAFLTFCLPSCIY